MTTKTEPAAQTERDAYTIPEFCKSHRICLASFYNLEKRGQAPRTFRVGRRRLVSVEAAAEWRRAMEAQSA
ncbi:hypothetical protein [Methylocaldum sp.]|uniref:hypothetical protein n=1 Tax=Methylocaldum sp. TaxID=1969727 RepID=UPI002D5440E0|nr:hypothetical protein [Methylocaldum sp.]HYE35669.1 hypothetical protein [Methylocaldum sp.]